ncbi:metallophosphoesterase [Haloferax mediterranei ATCC 33500]|uniref:Phosphoesterase n=1 Tax=Haloferax mediterranei (strain ATCC 33500 / DSM 1411 / JCM 8866 / NBRC 14739 / NCIMB 2177 / R-4) TaxID=523841 RepID=I3R659_HALMT|nr:metallophosphoesterase family protein [Haloferax mediterranei]AFK19719.1 putative phosphoesterase [Haloferax mediterranei ATCC 33500]AHZ23107.1 phosphoesterase [Haloferax mediterranei ATCC 33500]EMA00041.1 putative phosphoesterase [Haloferax mediterranei ATCC 33500]MDX5987536.1 metallophosphoesterase family protein [Haloferax mediterranei ATCC 33500]QCQ74033.1 metallophosphoesterase [Haloferax mediterranei ATCC 33500]
MRLAILSDTHVPGRVDAIPMWVEDRVRAADLVIHAGDFDSAETLEHLRSLSSRFVGVCGNVDPPEIDLPFVEVVEFNGLTFVVTHGTGTRTGYLSRVAEVVRDAAGTGAVGIAGHIHEVLDEVVDGIRILNPGTATAANPSDDATMMVGSVVDGSLSVEVVRGG